MKRNAFATTSAEVAEASHALKNELPVAFRRPTHANTLVDIAKKVQRLQTKARKLRRELKAAEHELRAEKRNLRALIIDTSKGRA